MILEGKNQNEDVLDSWQWNRIWSIYIMLLIGTYKPATIICTISHTLLAPHWALSIIHSCSNKATVSSRSRRVSPPWGCTCPTSSSPCTPAPWRRRSRGCWSRWRTGCPRCPPPGFAPASSSCGTCRTKGLRFNTFETIQLKVLLRRKVK